jgi:hypothetical protein
VRTTYLEDFGGLLDAQLLGQYLRPLYLLGVDPGNLLELALLLV